MRVTTTSPITRPNCTASVLDLDFVDDPDDGRVDRAILQTRRHPCRAAADDEHRLADAGIDGVDGDQVVSFRLAAGIHGTNDEQLAADKARIFAGRDDGTDDFPEKH